MKTRISALISGGLTRRQAMSAAGIGYGEQAWGLLEKYYGKIA